MTFVTEYATACLCRKGTLKPVRIRNKFDRKAPCLHHQREWIRKKLVRARGPKAFYKWNGFCCACVLVRALLRMRYCILQNSLLKKKKVCVERIQFFARRRLKCFFGEEVCVERIQLLARRGRRKLFWEEVCVERIQFLARRRRKKVFADLQDCWICVGR